MRLWSLLVATCVACGIAAPALGMGEPLDVSATLAPIVEKTRIPGMAAAIIRDGKIYAIGASGVRAIGHEQKVTIEDKWHLGSCTKAMTATLAGVMVEENELAKSKRIDWETRVVDVFPNVAMKPGWKTCTLEMLLQNRGGVPTELNKDGLWSRLWNFKGGAVDARRELLNGVLSWEPSHKPGTAYEYSNGGFAIAGLLVETRAGKPWEELMTARIFKPLGITSAGFGAPGTPDKWDQPCGHAKGKVIKPGAGSDNPVAISPAGRVHMTISDWAKFVGAHAAGESTPESKDEKRLLKPETFRKLHTPAEDPGMKYAMGWNVTSRPWAKGKGAGDTGRVLQHNGSNTMWFCSAWVAPERNFAVVVACNQGDGEAQSACDQAASALIQLDAANERVSR